MVVSWAGVYVPALQAQNQTIDNKRNAKIRPNAYITALAFHESKPHPIGDNELRA
jgi:hypothetical protein